MNKPVIITAMVSIPLPYQLTSKMSQVLSTNEGISIS
ncbi:hypothetical protein AN944_01676 [Shewanella sp. P1-14-1]|nr:hypothetical protein AN944_01676 [Shewanella sp. P1-14-1]